MPDVLSTMKDSKGQSCQKVSWRQIACHWPDLESSFLSQVDVNILQLWNIIRPVASFPFKFTPVLQEFRASIFFMDFFEAIKDFAPGVNFFLAVFDPWNRLTPTNKIKFEYLFLKNFLFLCTYCLQHMAISENIFLLFLYFGSLNPG